MKFFSFNAMAASLSSGVLCCVLVGTTGCDRPVALFDGRSLAGWEGETNTVWRVQDGVIVGGSLEGNPQNEFLATRATFTNFHLQFEFKLIGDLGCANSGVQFRSKRISKPPNEMSGYQADIGQKYTGCLYDESRRNRVLAQADAAAVKAVFKSGEWNRYDVVAVGPEVTLSINGRQSSHWIETDAGISNSGQIALQIHGHCKAQVAFRNISIQVLPSP
jgi:hypothetical protein